MVQFDFPAQDVKAHQPKRDRPLITLAYAQSLDGSIAVTRHHPLALSGPESSIITHTLRATHDAIIVGIGTILADDPSLTVRLVEGPDPQPIILDSHLRFPLNARMLHNKRPPWIATTTDAGKSKQNKLEFAGASVIRVPPDNTSRVDLEVLLEQLATQGIQSIMVEGGARVITSFLSHRLVDQLVLTITPVLVGGLHSIENALSSNGDKHKSTIPFPRLKEYHYEQMGSDLLLRAKIMWDAE